MTRPSSHSATPTCLPNGACCNVRTRLRLLLLPLLERYCASCHDLRDWCVCDQQEAAA